MILNCYHIKILSRIEKILTQWETNDEECTLPARGVRRDWRERIERVYAAEADRVGRVLETGVLYTLPLFRMFASLVFSTLVAKCREYLIRWYLRHEQSDTGLGARYEGRERKRRNESRTWMRLSLSATIFPNFRSNNLQSFIIRLKLTRD